MNDLLRWAARYGVQRIMWRVPWWVVGVAIVLYLIVDQVHAGLLSTTSAATNVAIDGSEAKVRGLYWKVEIPFVAPGNYRACLPLGIAALDLGAATPDDDGELKMEGRLPAGNYPLMFTVHVDAGDCSATPAFFSEQIVDEDEIEEPEDVLIWCFEAMDNGSRFPAMT